jgi:hypothetical protein
MPEWNCVPRSTKRPSPDTVNTVNRRLVIQRNFLLVAGDTESGVRGKLRS